MKRLTLIFLIIFFVIMSSVLTFFIYTSTKSMQVNTFPMNVRVIDEKKVGINADSGGFYFGSLNRGGGASRQLQITDIEKDAILYVSKKGEMSEWVNHPNGFLVKKGEDINLSFSIVIPMDVELGNYSGEITISLRDR